MKNGLLIALVACLFSNNLNAKEFFQDCNDVSEDSSYRLLNEYFSNKDEVHERCQRLNDSEFLYTTESNIFYCKSGNNASLSCEASEPHQWFSNLTYVRGFTGANGKQFVLFFTHLLSHGYSSDGYHVFYLVPKKANPRGYTVTPFRDAGASDSNDGEGTCVDTNDNEVVTYRSPGFEIVNENKKDVLVRFNQERTNCKTGEKSKQTLEYTWQNGSFQQTKNQLDKLPPKH